MKCRYCGYAIDDKAEFCGSCGMRIPKTFVSVEPGARVPGASRRGGGISNWIKGSVIAGLIGIVLIIVGILVVITAFTSFFDTVLDGSDEPMGMVKDILGGFGRIVVGAIMIAIGGTLTFWAFIGFIVGAIDSR
jgi:hypothetical protein